MNAFCASVNFDAFMRFRSSPSQERVAENSSFKRPSFQEAEQLGHQPISATTPLQMLKEFAFDAYKTVFLFLQATSVLLPVTKGYRELD